MPEFLSPEVSENELITEEKIGNARAQEIKKLVRLLYVFDNKRTDLLAEESMLINIQGNLSSFILNERSILKITPSNGGNIVGLSIVVDNGFQEGGLPKNIFMATTEVDIKQETAKHTVVGVHGELGPELQLGINQWLNILKEIKDQTSDKRINNPIV